MSVQRRTRRRMLLTLGIYSLVFIALTVRLGYLQLLEGSDLERRALAQWAQEAPASPERGKIYDRNGREMAITTEADTVVAIPARIEDADRTAAELAAVLNLPARTILERITRERALVYVARQVTPEEAARVRALSLPGISFKVENRRYYPHNDLASHVLGFVGVDGAGLAGIELSLNTPLAGEAARIEAVGEAESVAGAVGRPTYVPPLDGYHVYLTIDEVIQHIVERELERVMTTHMASGALAVAVHTQTGEILAMAAKPDYNPNAFSLYPDEMWRNAVISSSFEPGSTFKVITGAAALNEGLVDEDDKFICLGSVVVAGRTLHCHVLRGHGELTFAEVMYKSCNPSFVEIGQALGVSRLFSYIDAFGFGKRTGIELPGEAAGIMFSRIGPVELATTSFGQGPAVTPLQQVMAISAVANGGVLYKPSIVREIRDGEGNIIRSSIPQVQGYPITEETSQRLNTILAGVVAQGSGRNAFLREYTVAGKTGTAQIPKPGGGYYDDRYLASFIGYAPAENPQVTLMVMVNDPKGPYGYYGSQVAAPAFRNMMLDILTHLGVTPNEVPAGFALPNVIGVPALINLSGPSAIGHMKDIGLNLRIEGKGSSVIAQDPVAGTYLLPGNTVTITLGEPVRSDGLVEVPDIRGMTMRDAALELSSAGLRVIIDGSGLAVSQDPMPGSRVRVDTAVRVTFRP